MNSDDDYEDDDDADNDVEDVEGNQQQQQQLEGQGFYAVLMTSISIQLKHQTSFRIKSNWDLEAMLRVITSTKNEP